MTSRRRTLHPTKIAVRCVCHIYIYIYIYLQWLHETQSSRMWLHETQFRRMFVLAGRDTIRASAWRVCVVARRLLVCGWKVAKMRSGKQVAYVWLEGCVCA